MTERTFPNETRALQALHERIATMTDELTESRESMQRLAAECRRLAELNRSEGWSGNDCDEAMRALNNCAALLEASAWDSGPGGKHGVGPVMWEALEDAVKMAERANAARAALAEALSVLRAINSNRHAPTTDMEWAAVERVILLCGRTLDAPSTGQERP